MYFLFVCALCALLLIFLLDSIKAGIAPTPTSKKVKEKILEILPAKVEGEIYELGSGFGRMAISFCYAYPKAKIKSFEIAKIPLWVQKLLLLYFRPNNMQLLETDFRDQNLSNAGFVFCYLYRGIMPTLSEKFKKELQSGTWIISHTFALPNWKPIKTVYVKDLYHTPIYLYQV